MPFLALAGCGEESQAGDSDRADTATAAASASDSSDSSAASTAPGPQTANPDMAPEKADAQADAKTSASLAKASGKNEDESIFRAAGFRKRGAQWHSECDDPGTISYSPGEIEQVGDLNGDGLPEAIVTEGGTYCYGMTGMGFWLMSRQGDGNWKVMASQIGIPEILKTKGAGGWPDIQLGGPGFCFPIWRWNGKEYDLHRTEYEGRPCRPPAL